MLTLKLARRNLQSAFKVFAPFLLASITMFTILFVTASITLSPSIEKLRAGATVGSLMGFAMVVLAIFGAIILIYGYRFLQLQRLREFGLYDILGFGKLQIALVGFWELLLSYLATLVVGTLVGIAFSKFLFLIFVNIIGGNYFNLVINPLAIAAVAAIFLLYFLLLFLVGSWIIYRSSSLDLLHESSKGEKEPKANIIFAILGLIAIAVGYYLALSVDNPIQAITTFFFAVLAVIVGTYLFYISVTVRYLKWRKKRASYYKPENFINISSMLYRMKANAVGLANITILLTMTLVTLLVTAGIFAGTTNTVMKQYPREGQLVLQGQPSREAVAERVKARAEKSGVAVKNLTTIQTANTIAFPEHQGDELKLSATSGETIGRGVISVQLTTAQDWLALGNKLPETLKSGQVALYDFSGNPSESAKSLELFGERLEVGERLSQKKAWAEPQTISDGMLVIFPDEASLKAVEAPIKNQVEFGLGSLQTIALYDLPSQSAEKFAAALPLQSGESVSNRTTSLQDSRALVGGFLFIGFVLGLSFVLGAALIIYYKQVAEGQQDKKAFHTLQELGLSKPEVARTISGQIRLIFFLPIVVAVVHLAFAYRMLSKLINLFGINDPLLLISVAVITIVVILLIYTLIYRLTSKIYYKIVER